MKTFTIAAGLALLALCASGCAALRKDYQSFDYNTPSGPRSGLRSYGDFEIDLPSLIDPDDLGKWREAKDAGLSAQINLASLGFYRYSADRPKSVDDVSSRKPSSLAKTEGAWDYDLILRRNAVQDHIMAYADERCRYWKDYFGTLDSRVGFGLGSLSSLFAVGGAAFKDAATVRALSALAGVTTGVRSEFERAYLHDLSMQVLMQAIDLHRARVRAEIMARRGDVTAAPPVVALQAFNAAAWNVGTVDPAKLAADAAAVATAQSGMQAAATKKADTQNEAKAANDVVLSAPTPTNRKKAGKADADAQTAEKDAESAADKLVVATAMLGADLPAPAHPGVPAWKADKIEDIRIYTLERAVADALRYYEACSVSGGLEEAAQSVQTARSPDLSSFYAQQLLVLQQQTLIAQEEKKVYDIRQTMKADTAKATSGNEAATTK